MKNITILVKVLKNTLVMGGNKKTGQIRMYNDIISELKIII